MSQAAGGGSSARIGRDGKDASKVLDRALDVLERPGRVWAAIGISLGLVWLTLLRVSLGLWPTHLGKSYADLSRNPFAPAPGNPVALRILAPLVSYLVGMRGSHILFTNLF